MRSGINDEIKAALAGMGIVTALVARLDFKDETLFVWTGQHPMDVTGTGQALLDGHRLEPIASGIPVDMSENSYSLTGSDEFKVSIAIPADAGIAINASQVYPDEYQGRPATIWRALRYLPTDPLAQPVWAFRPIRSGAMDKVEVTNDGKAHNFTLTIESHQAAISAASNQTYLDQKKYDPTDTSQDFAAAIANGDPAPAKGASFSIGSGFGAGVNFGGVGGGWMNNQVE